MPDSELNIHQAATSLCAASKPPQNTSLALTDLKQMSHLTHQTLLLVALVPFSEKVIAQHGGVHKRLKTKELVDKASIARDHFCKLAGRRFLTNVDRTGSDD